MPRVRRSRTVRAEPDAVWAVVADPHALPRWWPGVERIEEGTRDAWTKVFRSGKGKTVRADFSLVDADAPRRLEWRQEVEESPFERFLREAVTRISLTPAEGGGTYVELEAVRRMRGLALLGGFNVRRATARQLDEALALLDEIVPRPS